MGARKLLDEALTLPPRERGQLVHELIKSLDEARADEPQAVEQAWTSELKRRAARAKRGTSSSRPAAEVLKELAAKRRKKS